MSCLSLISSIFVLCVSFAGCIDSDGCRVRRRSCMWILSSSSDGRLIMRALLHLPQIIPLPLLLLVVEVEGNPSFSHSASFDIRCARDCVLCSRDHHDGGLRSRDFHRPFDDEDLFFQWLSNGTPLSRSTASSLWLTFLT